jgi:hypothetical protein
MVIEILQVSLELLFFLLKEEGAGNHCHVAALSLANQRILNWLDETVRA